MNKYQNNVKNKLCTFVFILMFALFTLMFVLTGCAKLISTETSTVQVKITGEHYEKPYTEYHYHSTFHRMEPCYHPSVYIITVEYNGEEYDISGKYTYERYSDSIGTYTKGTLRTRKYNDGSVRYEIIDLEL